MTGDGRADLVVAGGSVRVYDGKTGGLVGAFNPYPTSGGLSVAVGDLEGDGRAEIATASGKHVKVFGADGDAAALLLRLRPVDARRGRRRDRRRHR